jgi:hypothetical protein
MSFLPVTSLTPPTVGNSKKLYSVDLFDFNTGAYPKAGPPSTVTYTPDQNGKFLFFESAIAARLWPTSDDTGGAGKGQYAWDEQNVTPPNFITYYEDTDNSSAPPPSVTQENITFSFDGNPIQIVTNMKIKINYRLTGSASATGDGVGSASIGYYVALDGVNFGSLQVVDGFTTETVNPVVGFDSTQTTYESAAFPSLDLSLLKIKINWLSSAVEAAGTATVQDDLKVYALYLEP